MSKCYWGIRGYGVCLDNIEKYLNSEKTAEYLKKLFINQEINEDPFEDDVFCGNPYNSFAEFLLEFDEKKILDYETDGHGTDYLLYIPPYPWIATQHEPKTLNELRDYICFVLKKVYDAPASILYDAIDYIDTAGCS